MNSTGRATGSPPHVRLHYWVMATPAWRALPCEARASLVELYSLYNGLNNGEIFLSVREAARRLNIGKTTAANAFKALIGCGFIRPYVKGAFSRKVKHATQWVLTEFEFAAHPPPKTFTRLSASQAAALVVASKFNDEEWALACSEIQNTVRPEGQTVPTAGQRDQTEGENLTICPHSETDVVVSEASTVRPEGHR